MSSLQWRLHQTWAIRENILPLQDVVPRRLIYCSPQRSSDRKRRIVENWWFNKTGELTDLWRPGTQRHGERPQQPCRREERMKAAYGCNKLKCLANTLASKKPATHTHNSSQNNTLWMLSNVNMEGNWMSRWRYTPDTLFTRVAAIFAFDRTCTECS